MEEKGKEYIEQAKNEEERKKRTDELKVRRSAPLFTGKLEAGIVGACPGLLNPSKRIMSCRIDHCPRIIL